ncbi:hypothetical protein C7476_111127 [Phyllobacterium bourgognense]|uniref:Uncharacterized protein n=1 Tax=Phyllobacterium bourgognense TaxID=314236 RepID=A0A368YM57_9HYPH|nr:hypothetical protein C7476_111127 [Phyllobacterium bourgognense]
MVMRRLRNAHAARSGSGATPIPPLSRLSLPRLQKVFVTIGSVDNS